MGEAEAQPVRRLTVGVLALQGAFEEHRKILDRLSTVDTVEVRVPEELDAHVDGLIIPGGESTAMAIVGERTGIFPRLKEYVESGKPVWGTCAGMILLSNKALLQKAGGQALVGGLDVEVCRNYFGSQIDSFEVPLKLEGPAAKAHSNGSCSAVFIRAPAVLKAGEGVEVLARVRSSPCAAARKAVEEFDAAHNDGESLSKQKVDGDGASSSSDDKREVIVAVQQGNILATAFHPELTDDVWWHEYFLGLLKDKSKDT